MHDPEAYEDPLEFRPERFIKDGKLDPSVRDPTNYMFGFGRRHVQFFPALSTWNTSVTSPNRICPGRYLALPSLFINMASMLHVFDFSLPLDDNGQPLPVKYEEGHGLVTYVLGAAFPLSPSNIQFCSHPEDFQCVIKPRSAEAEALILEAYRLATAEVEP